MTATRALVSVIVPTYQSAGYLPQLCESLQAQTHGDFEVLLGDDASGDGTREVLRPFLKDPRFRYFSWETNRGVGATTYDLMTRAAGEFWCHPGSDDALLPGFMAARLELLRSRPGAAIAHGPPILMDRWGKVTTSPDPQWKVPTGASWPTLPQLLQHNTINVPGIMGRTQALRNVLPLLAVPWRAPFDWFIWLLLASNGGEFVYDAEPRHYYRIHPASISNNPSSAATVKAESRLVPLCGLAAGAALSVEARRLWGRYRRALYDLWLTRAATLARHGLLRDEWLQRAARAFYSDNYSRVTLRGEILRRFPCIMADFLTERKRVDEQAFRVTGLALVNDRFFRKGSETICFSAEAST